MTNMKLASETEVTVVVAGDSKVGKTALIQRFIGKNFQQVYMPTSFDKSFSKLEVNKHQVHFSFWDTSGSPAYDSVRPLSYQEADVFLLCYKISDPISLYNVKNKWIRELRRHRPDVPVILCGCQADLRSDLNTVSHLSKTGRTPVSQEQALAICCEIEALHYVETSAKTPDKDNVEAFEVCAMAAIKYHNAKNMKSGSTFKRSPSINSTMSLFETPSEGVFKRSPSTHSSLSLSAGTPTASRIAFPFTMRKNVPQLNSPSSFSECDGRMSAFSPEPLSRGLPGPLGTCYEEAPRIPPVISENEAYQDGEDYFTPFSGVNNLNNNQFTRRGKLQRPSSLCDAKQIMNCSSEGLPLPQRSIGRLQRPTTLFKSSIFHNPSQLQQQSPALSPQYNTASYNNFNNNNNNNNNITSPMYSNSTIFTPTGDPQQRAMFYQPKANVEPRRFDSLSELGTPTSISSTPDSMLTQVSAQIRPNNLGRRTSYRTYQKVPIPVAAPMSPIGTSSECSFEMKSPNSSMCQSPRAVASPLVSSHSNVDTVNHDVSSPSPCPIIPVFEPFKAYESLKSQMSTSSQASSTTSKMSFSDLSSDVSSLTSPLRPIGEAQTTTVRRNLPDKGVPDTEDPELIKKLSFISPKSGVYRPVAEGRRYKQGCHIM